MTVGDIGAFAQDKNVLPGAEGMPSMPLDHDCLIIITPHMHCCGEMGALVAELEAGTPSMPMLVLCTCCLDCIQVATVTWARA
jgi:hypothetical protein